MPTRGRHPENAPRKLITRYELFCSVKEVKKAIEQERQASGCFVVLTNIPVSGSKAMSAAELLTAYKGQNAIEANFSFLKDPLVVNDIFIKTPSRIEVLGMVLIIALMIWRLMERAMRTTVENQQITLPGWDKKPTTKPTAFMMSVMMTDVMTACLQRKTVLLKPPTLRT